MEPLHVRNFRIPVFVFVGWILLLEFPGSSDLVRSPYSGLETENLVVQNVRAAGPNAGADIRRGDVIVAVDGRPVRNYNHLRHLIRQNTTHAPQAYAFDRDGKPVTVRVNYVQIPASIVYRRFASLVVGFTFLLMGLFVLLRRFDSVGILFSLNCAIFAYFLSDHPVAPSAFLQIATELFQDAVMLAFPAVFLHFFLVFHDRPRGISRRTRVRRAVALYTLPVVLYAVSAYFAIRSFLLISPPSAAVDLILTASTLYMSAYLIASLFVFIRNYRSSSRAQKQKLRIAIAGTTIGILPFLATTVWRQIATGSNTPLEFISVLALSFISISFAYAILKHGAIELNIVLRRSLGYAFLAGTIVVTYYGVVNLLGDFLQKEFTLGSTSSTVFSMITILIIALIFAPARNIIQRVVDRLFRKDDYDYKHEVLEFGRRLSRKLKRKEIRDYFCERAGTLLGVTFIAYYTPRTGGGEWTLEHTCGDAPDLPPLFPIDSLLGRYFSRYKKPLMVEYLDYSWGRRNLDATSTGFLDSSRAAVCVPVMTSDSTIAAVVLGAKSSGRLYTRTDSLLLERFAAQLALVLENAELHEATIEQERLKNELMLAREIQLSLLPKDSPHHPAIEMEGRMASSDEVGGDYFDYFELESDRIGVCIGDVNGHGVPAAMLMSSIQAVFKNLALKDRMNPSDLVSELNHYLCGSAKNDQFATFFYGILDLSDSTFTYANAGHCPALLLKPAYADRLGEGGMPLGVNRAQVYREGTARVESGDMLCLYTDGVTEQTGENEQEFGESGLIDFLRANRNLPLSQLQDTLFARVLDFGQGVQHDDVTCIIAHHNAV
ncbi:MAG: SpoIIE family protein phosphatase [Candidatus Krumholzibacteriia bacterium]